MPTLTAEEKKQKTANDIALALLAVLLVGLSIGAWRFLAFLDAARRGATSPEKQIGRALSEANPELFQRELQEHRDAEAAYARELEAQQAVQQAAR